MLEESGVRSRGLDEHQEAGMNHHRYKIYLGSRMESNLYVLAI